MSRYDKKIINNFNINQGIQHSDPDLNKKLMNYKYNKEGCFYLNIEILDFKCRTEIVGDAAAGLPALAEIIGKTFKKNDYSENLLKIFFDMIEKYMEDDDENYNI